MRGQFIVVTGLDGSGKDYVAEHLQRIDPGSVIIKTPTEPFVPARFGIDGFALEVPAAHYYFYLASVIHASSLAEKALIKGNVYCVRYLLDTVVHHRAIGLSVELQYTTPISQILRPTFTFFLNVEDELVRQRRLSNREKLTVGDVLVNQSAYRSALLREYEHYASEFIVIDNGDRDIELVIHEIRTRMSLDA